MKYRINDSNLLTYTTAYINDYELYTQKITPTAETYSTNNKRTKHMNSKFTSTLAIGQYEIIKYIHKGLVIPSCTKRTEYSILEIDDNYITIKGKQTVYRKHRK